MDPQLLVRTVTFLLAENIHLRASLSLIRTASANSNAAFQEAYFQAEHGPHAAQGQKELLESFDLFFEGKTGMEDIRALIADGLEPRGDQ